MAGLPFFKKSAKKESKGSSHKTSTINKRYAILKIAADRTPVAHRGVFNSLLALHDKRRRRIVSSAAAAAATFSLASPDEKEIEDELKQMTAVARSLFSGGKIYTFRLCYTVALTSTAGPINIFNTFPASSVATLSEWGSFSALFDEFRVRAIYLEYQPHNRYNRGAVLTEGMGVCNDYDSNTPVASIVSALVHSEAMLASLDDPIHWWWVYPETGIPQPWIDVATPAGALGAILFAALGNLTASTVYGFCGLHYILEGRGRQ